MGWNQSPDKIGLLEDLVAGYSYYYFLAYKPEKYARLFHEWGWERGKDLSSRRDLAELYQLWPAGRKIKLDDFLESGSLVRKSKPYCFEFEAGDSLCFYTRGVLEGYLHDSRPAINSLQEIDCVADNSKHCQFIASEDHQSLTPPRVSDDNWQEIKSKMAAEIVRISHKQQVHDFKVSPEAFVRLSEIAERVSTSALQLLGHDFGNFVGKAIKEPEFPSYLEQASLVTSELGWDCAKRQLLDSDLMISFRPRSDLEHEQNKSWLQGVCKGMLEEFTNTEWHVSRIRPDRKQIRFKCRNL